MKHKVGLGHAMDSPSEEKSIGYFSIKIMSAVYELLNADQGHR
jgi:hypothetical protein